MVFIKWFQRRLLGPVLVNITTLIILSHVVQGQHVPGAWSQKKVSISMKVKDANNREDLPAVLVVLTNLNDSTRVFLTTNDNGIVTFNLKPGRWQATLKLVGYKDTSFVISASEDEFLGTIYLVPVSKKLKEVEVKVSASEESADKTTFLVTKALKENTTTARDVLQKLPGIQYNPLDDAFMVDNNPNILILVNGMEKSEEYVKNIPPDRILKIEIIRDPTGRYGLEGYSAIINIILRDDYVGYDFSYSGMVAYSPFLEGVPYKVPFAFSGISGSYSYNKNTIYASVYSWMPRPPRIELDSMHLESPVGIIVFNYSIPPKNMPINNYGSIWGMRASAGIDHTPHPGQILSVELTHRRDIIPSTFTGSWAFRDVWYFDSISPWNLFMDTTTIINRSTSSASATSGINGFMKTQLDKINTLTLDVRVRNGTGNTKNTYKEGFASLDQISTTKTSRWRIIGEWEKQWSDLVGSITGVGIHRRKELGKFVFKSYFNDTLDLADSVITKMDLLRLQTYVYATLKTGKFTFKGGTAFEYYNYSVDSLKLSVSVFQPALDILWKFHKILSLRLRYRVNFKYPSIRDLLPGFTTITSYVYKIGNPNLKPYFVHKLSLQLGAYGGRARIEPYVRWSKNFITNKIDTIGTLSIGIMPVNAGLYRRIGLNAAIPIPMGKKLFALINFDIYKELLQTDNTVNTVSDFTSFFMISYTFANRKLSVGVMQINSVAKEVTATGYKMGGERHADMWIFFMRSFWLKRRLSVGVSYIPPLRILGADYAFLTYDDIGFVKRWSIVDIVPTRNSIALRVSYSFSKGEIKKRKRDRNEEEMMPQMF